MTATKINVECSCVAVCVVLFVCGLCVFASYVGCVCSVFMWAVCVVLFVCGLCVFCSYVGCLCCVVNMTSMFFISFVCSVFCGVSLVF